MTAVHRETISLFTGGNAEQITVKTLRDLDGNFFNEINAGRPVIVFGAGFPDTSRGHAVVAYGIHQVNSLVANLIVHYGWDKEYNKVYLDSGLIASSTQFMLC